MDHIHHISIRLTQLPRPNVDKSMEFLARNQKWRKPAGQNGEFTLLSPVLLYDPLAELNFFIE